MKKFLWFIPVAVIAGVAALGMGLVAHAQGASGTTKFPPVIQALIDKFHLPTDQVQQVIDQSRAEQKAKAEANFNTKLDSLVSGGQLTEAQKAAILAKRAELQAQEQSEQATRQSTDWQSLTPAERQAQMDALKQKMQADKQALTDWAQANGIDTKYLYLVGGFGGGFGHGHMMGHMFDNTDGTPPATTQQ